MNYFGLRDSILDNTLPTRDFHRNTKRQMTSISRLNYLSGKNRRDLDFHFAQAAVEDHSEIIDTARIGNHEDLILRIGDVDEPDFGERERSACCRRQPSGPFV